MRSVLKMFAIRLEFVLPKVIACQRIKRDAEPYRRAKLRKKPRSPLTSALGCSVVVSKLSEQK